MLLDHVIRRVTRRVVRKNSKKGLRILLERDLRTENSTFLKALQVPHSAGFFMLRRTLSLALEQCVLPAFSLPDTGML